MNGTTKLSGAELAAIVQGGGSRRWLRWCVVAATLLAAAAAFLLWRTHRAKLRAAEPAYSTVPLRRGEIALTITATGNLEPTTKVTVGSELSGTASEVFVTTNDRVRKGQPLAALDTRKLALQTESRRATLKAAYARVTQVEATVKEAEAHLARQQELFRVSGGKVPSRSELDVAVASAERARADLLSANASVGESEAAIQINESDLAKAVITSPIDGIVLKRSVEPGQTVAASFTAPELFVIAESLEQMKLKIAISESDIGRVAVGNEATFTVDAWPNRSYTAKVVKVQYGSAIADNIVTYQAELEVENRDMSLRPGMTATADVHVAEAKGVFVVPTAALRFDPAAARTALEAVKPDSGKAVFSEPKKHSPVPESPVEVLERLPPGMARVWIARENRPMALSVAPGLSDGRSTQISGEGLTEGLPIITNLKSAGL